MEKDMRHYLFIPDLDELKRKMDDPFIYGRLKSECDRLFSMYLPPEHPKKSTTYIGISIMNLSLMYLVSREERYLEEARRFIETVLGYEKWGNAHLVNVDLSAAWILFGLSLSYDWLKDDIDMKFRERIEKKLMHHAACIYDYALSHQDESWPSEYWQNHNWIDFSGLAAAGYALSSVCPEQAALYVEMARKDFELVFTLLSDDGSNYEGVPYWRYGGMWLFVYAWMSLSEEGKDYFSSSGYLRNTFFFRLYQGSGTLLRQLDFGDCHDRYSSNPVCVYYLVARMYRNGYAAAFADKVMRQFFQEEAFISKVGPGLLFEAGLEYIWYDASVDKKSFDDLPLSVFFPDLGLVAKRQSWKDDSRVFTFKCGCPGGRRQLEAGSAMEAEGKKCLSLSHNHPDNQSYILVRGEDYLVREDGYNRNILPGEHSNILVDGRYTDADDKNDIYVESMRMRRQENPDFNAFCDGYMGVIESYEDRDGMLFLSSENSGIYPLDLHMTSVKRKVFSPDLDFIVLYDYMSSPDPHVYSVGLNSDEVPAEEESGMRYFPSHSACYYVFSDTPLVFENRDYHVKAIMTTQEPDKFVEVDIKRACSSTSEKVREAAVFELICYSGDVSGVSYGPDGLSVKTEKGTYAFSACRESLTVSLDGALLKKF